METSVVKVPLNDALEDAILLQPNRQNAPLCVQRRPSTLVFLSAARKGNGIVGAR